MAHVRQSALSCPQGLSVLPLKEAKVIHVGFDDPPKLAAAAANEAEALDHYRRVRDQIRRFVETLPGALIGRS